MNDLTKITSQERLLLNLCRLKFSEEDCRGLAALITEITDWEHFKIMANQHGVTALIYNNLEKHHLLSGIPEAVAAYLKKSYFKSLSRNTYNAEALKECLNVFDRAGIKSVVLKGMVLENTIYGNTGLRQMSDIDILVTREDCLKARNLLLASGYKSLPVKSFLHKSILAYSGKHLPSLIKNSISIEIHLELFGDKKKSLTQLLYDTSYEVRHRDEKGWFPEPQIFFLYLVRHLWYHELNNESQIRLYTDLVVMLENHSETILTRDLIRMAELADMNEILSDRLKSLRDIFLITFPRDINDYIDLYSSTDSLDKFLNFLKTPKNKPTSSNPESYRQIIRDIPGLHRKILYIAGDIFPGFRFMKQRYGCRSSVRILLYYPKRIGKLMWLINK